MGVRKMPTTELIYPALKGGTGMVFRIFSGSVVSGRNPAFKRASAKAWLRMRAIRRTRGSVEFPEEEEACYEK